LPGKVNCTYLRLKQVVKGAAKVKKPRVYNLSQGGGRLYISQLEE